MYDDETLIECIKDSGYFDCQEVCLEDIPNDKRIAIILATELLSLRPELGKPDSDILYIKKEILENGGEIYSLPSKSLSKFLKEPPFEDSTIWTYSIKEEKTLKRLYRGTGIFWERVK